MGTRSGDLDASVVEYLVDTLNIDMHEWKAVSKTATAPALGIASLKA